MLLRLEAGLLWILIPFEIFYLLHGLFQSQHLIVLKSLKPFEQNRYLISQESSRHLTKHRLLISTLPSLNTAPATIRARALLLSHSVDSSAYHPIPIISLIIPGVRVSYFHQVTSKKEDW